MKAILAVTVLIVMMTKSVLSDSLNIDQIETCIKEAETTMSEIVYNKNLDAIYDTARNTGPTLTQLTSFLLDCKEFTERVYWAQTGTSCKHDLLDVNEDILKQHGQYYRFADMKKFCIETKDRFGFFGKLMFGDPLWMIKH